MSISAERLRVAVISDIHAYMQEPSGITPSWYDLRHPLNANPISSLKDLISESTLRADMLLIPGDLGDRADPAAIAAAWNTMQELKELLKADHLLATVGNHDVDSRAAFSSNTFGVLRNLSPSFPFPHLSTHDYWTTGFEVIGTDNANVVVVNSCDHHGGPVAIENNHGQVSTETLNRLTRRISEFERRPVNILLTHHHVIQDSLRGGHDVEVMTNGGMLMDLVQASNNRNWIVIHGHRHIPRIRYAAGGNSAPVVFSAASISARLYAEAALEARNQFHLIEFPLKPIREHGLVGTFHTWTWTLAGWRAALQGDGLPHRGGFGYRGSLQSLAGKAAAALRESHLSWSQLLTTVPEVQFLLPCDLKVLLEDLRENHRVRMELNEQGIPAELKAD